MKSIVFTAIAAVWLACPANDAHAAACVGFVDIDSANATYCPAVTYLKNTGITTGCDATHYCPNDAVTRLQMALFIKRMSDKAVFRQGGNAFGAQAVIGTTDQQSVKVLVGNATLWRGYRLDTLIGSGTSMVGGDDVNVLGEYAFGSVIGGGGAPGNDCGFQADEPCNHQVDQAYAVIGGGLHNRVTQRYGTVGGGNENVAGQATTVAGGSGNHASGSGQSIAGGVFNSSGELATYATVGGGIFNVSDAPRATVAGGYQNYAGAQGATISGGENNTAYAEQSVVAGGDNNSANAQYATVGGGQWNSASGFAATAPGGLANLANGAYSVVLGSHAMTAAAAQGSFVFSDSTLPDTNFTSSTANQFLVGTAGGIRMMTNKDMSTGCSIAAGGGSWSCTSSKAVKRDFSDVDMQDVLDKVATLPVQRWRYAREDEAVRHLGTFAEDFHAAFGLGGDNTSIAMADADGVALAAIQALYARQLATTALNADLRGQVDALLARIARLEALQGN